MSRWPIIRHIRYLYWSWQVEKHYTMWLQLGMLPVHRHIDIAWLDRIWRGEE